MSDSYQRNNHLDTGAIPITAAHPTAARQYQNLSETSTSQKRSKTPIPGPLKVLILAAFVIALGFGLIAPVLPRYAASFDVGVQAASAVVSMFAATRLLFAPASGKLVSRWGERPIYMAGLIIVALGSLGVAISWSYPVLMAFRALGGIGSVMFTVSAMGLLVRYSPAHLRGKISGYYATAFLIGNILGPVVGSLMVGLGMRLPFVIYAVVLFIACILVFFYLKEAQYAGSIPPKTQPELSLKDAWKFTNFRAGLGTNFAIGWAALGLRVALMPLAAVALLTSYHQGEHYDPDHGGIVLAGLAMAFYAGGNAITQNISGRFSDKHGRRNLIFYGLLLAGVSTILVGLSGSPVLFIIFSITTGIGTGVLGPSLQAAVADIVGNERSGGTVLATYQMFADLGQIVGPLLAGWIADHWGYNWAFGISGALLLVMMLGWLPWRSPRFPKELAETGYTGR
ncbi:MFS transporter [Rothia sp. P7181]|uniref:MFS transporter n=1 Tax=unclassified Rothia (in: high G+C Gram-positive bacteria) TaxID=2689056 RepID=UPI003ACB9880